MSEQSKCKCCGCLLGDCSCSSAALGSFRQTQEVLGEISDAEFMAAWEATLSAMNTQMAKAYGGN